MHVLLPPSESKRPGGRGRPIGRGPTPAAGDALADARRTALGALQVLVAGDPSAAATALALPAGVAADALAADAAAADSPTMPALRRYTGVVYDGLGFDALTPAEQRLARRSCRIFSGLFGVLRGDEPVPDYRVPAKAVLPGLGVAGTWWRPVLTEVLRPVLRRGLVVDLRSSDYRAMWRPDRDTSDRTLAVRVLSPAPRGGHAVISFTSKLAKGRLAAALVRRSAAGDPVASPHDVLAAWASCAGADPTRTPDPSSTATTIDLYTL
ncbi:peroxide stress protein YaaA [Jatrophihabitans endophyticus]|uniref:peroxide stress protein YaaA n=1 Tax=Jatrophihabitans endophyticus TaxID=1206085 RepID=UPI001A07E2D3|nr:peroxide stress protein YaaA [Jatrophihabitans endophyticus]MBE7186873.1 peroxide stress protein YaaA [Jatrophihabitans endophyticus]